MFTNTVFIYVMSNWNALCIAWKWETLTTTFFDKKKEKYTKTRKYWSKRNDINKKKFYFTIYKGHICNWKLHSFTFEIQEICV